MSVVILYVGDVDREGYEEVTRICDGLTASERRERATLVLATMGGDPDAGFRIARALQCNFEPGFRLVVPHMCKSAGTLIAVGARVLAIDDTGELGPLDIQLEKKDELFENASGLDLPQAIVALRSHIVETFRSSLLDVRLGGRLSTKIASEIATQITTGIFAPIFAQIDPRRLGETQRANSIAYEYGTRLEEKAENLNPPGLQTLIFGYPSHGFVIDRKEARRIFKTVESVAPEERSALRKLDLQWSAMLQTDHQVIRRLDKNHDIEYHAPRDEDAPLANIPTAE